MVTYIWLENGYMKLRKDFSREDYNRFSLLCSFKNLNYPWFRWIALLTRSETSKAKVHLLDLQMGDIFSVTLSNISRLNLYGLITNFCLCFAGKYESWEMNC